MPESAEVIAQFFYFEGGGFICFGAAFAIIFLTAFFNRSHQPCPRCEEVNRPEANFCAQCGQRLIDD